MSAWQTFRLAAWREGWGRWPIHVVAPLLAGVGLVLPEAAGVWWSRMVTLALVALVWSVASGGRVGADAFWRGLGGPGWARLAGAMAVQVPPLALAVALLQLRGGAVALTLLYTSVLLARALGGGLLVVFVPVLTGIGVAILWLLTQLFLFREADVLAGWSLVVSALLAGGALRAEHLVEGARRGARVARWGGAAGRAAAALLLAAVGLSLLPLSRVATIDRVPSESGSLLLLPMGVLSSFYTRAVVWDGEERHTIGPRGVWGGSVGPDGAAALERSYWAGALLLVAPDGASVECVVPRAREYSWRADGRAVLVETADGLYTIDIAAGCGTRIQSSIGGAWLGDRRVWAEEDAVHIEDTELARPGTVVGIVQSAGHVYTLAGGAVYVVTTVGLERLSDTPSDATSLRSVPHGVCALGGPVTRCWENGTHASVDHDRPPVDVQISWDLARQTLHDPTTGRVLAELVATDFRGYVAVLADGTVRVPFGDHVLDLSPSGAVSSRYF